MAIKFDLYKRATSAAFDRVARAVDVPVDPDLLIFERLTPELFDQIKAKYGEEALMDYIKTMENKRRKAKYA